MSRGDPVSLLEIIFCLLASIGLFTVFWALFGWLVRPGPGGLYIRVTLDDVSPSDGERLLRYLSWLWDMGFLSAPVRLICRDQERAKLFLERFSFLIYDGPGPGSEVER